MHAYNGCWLLGSYFTQLEAVAGFNDDRYGQKLVHNKSRKAEEKHWTCSPPHKYFFLSSIEKWKDESNESNENEECMLLPLVHGKVLDIRFRSSLVIKIRQIVCFGRSRTCIEAQLVHNPTSNLPFQATKLRENKCIIHKRNSFRNLFPKTSTVPYLAYAQGRSSPFQA